MTVRTTAGPGKRIPGPASSFGAFALFALQEVQPHQVREHMESPFPSWAAPLSRFLFSVPQWVMIGGIVLAAIVALAIAAFVWVKRDAILEGWRSHGRTFRRAAIAGLALVLLVTAGLGWESWSFMQHDNDFCQSCHIMDVPFEKFTTSEHSQLGCHDCHQQPISASIRQVYLWVLDRPEEIGEHAPVPNAICGTCHIQQRPDSVWQRVVATAGHRVHLESDSLPELLCVKCHGVEIHRFVPVSETCGQSGCHAPEKTQVVLGAMAGQNDLHCVTCHRFTAPVSEASAIDTARAALVPHQEQCFSCHRMQEQLVTFDPELEPHGAVCGTCHNPHTQESPEVAEESCAASACHARADTLTPFHRGLPDAVTEDCVGCHRAHTFLVEGENCAACHGDVPGAGGARAMARGTPVQMVALYREVRGRRASEWIADPAPERGFPQIRQGFAHASHTSIACTDCHAFDETHGAVTARTERDCMACHHTAPVVNRGCERCHSGVEAIERRVEFPMRLGAWEAARTRSASFRHAEHAAIGCATCHTAEVTRAATLNCASCHSEHHVATADCASCHAQPPDGAHSIEVHSGGCAGSGCHEDRAITAMPRSRAFCLSCHQDMREHEPGRTCATCHRVPDIAAGGGR